MDSRFRPSFSEGPRSSPVRTWLEVAVLLVLLLVLAAIEPINKAFVRNVIHRHSTDLQLSHVANEVVVQALLSRRFEKDMLLHVHDPSVRTTYRTQWTQATADLDQALSSFYHTAVSDSDRRQALEWQQANANYRAAVLQTLDEIDQGLITTAHEANRRLSPNKDDIRALTDSAVRMAERKEKAVDTSSLSLQHTLIGSARTLSLVVIAGCILWVSFRQRL